MDVALKYVVPSIGIIVSTFLYSSSFFKVREMYVHSTLKNVNPLPYPISSGNALFWFFYGTLLENHFVFLSNFPGFIITSGYSLLAFSVEKSYHIPLILVFNYLLGG